ncbi:MULTISPECIES: hypothetical protein [Novosphingobium]|uniref:hypothetical protein n=1 Tax=Novosphingobium TaxID=165696 RepID=UPI000AEFDAE7|nr:MULTISPECIES: hypothetical protein [Novosphingobium]GFM27656.1 uncharacterized protein PY1_contig-02-19 [Novosphingobium sp. PY1]
MARSLRVLTDEGERLPEPATSFDVTAELGKLLVMLREVCPPNADVSFDFDGQLHVRIDVRQVEEVRLIQSLLPSVGVGLFDNISHGRTPHRPFYHRISAVVIH